MTQYKANYNDSYALFIANIDDEITLSIIDALAELLEQNPYFFRIIKLYKSNATRKNIEDIINSFKNIDENDRVFVFVAGRWYSNNLLPSEYYICSDTLMDSIEKSAIPSSYFFDLPNICKAKHIALIIDESIDIFNWSKYLELMNVASLPEDNKKYKLYPFLTRSIKTDFTLARVFLEYLTERKQQPLSLAYLYYFNATKFNYPQLYLKGTQKGDFIFDEEGHAKWLAMIHKQRISNKYPK